MEQNNGLEKIDKNLEKPKNGEKIGLVGVRMWT